MLYKQRKALEDLAEFLILHDKTRTATATTITKQLFYHHIYISINISIITVFLPLENCDNVLFLLFFWVYSMLYSSLVVPKAYDIIDLLLCKGCWEYFQEKNFCASLSVSSLWGRTSFKCTSQTKSNLKCKVQLVNPKYL